MMLAMPERKLFSIDVFPLCFDLFFLSLLREFFHAVQICHLSAEICYGLPCKDNPSVVVIRARQGSLQKWSPFHLDLVDGCILLREHAVSKPAMRSIGHISYDMGSFDTISMRIC